MKFKSKYKQTKIIIFNKTHRVLKSNNFPFAYRYRYLEYVHKHKKSVYILGLLVFKHTGLNFFAIRHLKSPSILLYIKKAFMSNSMNASL